MHSSRPPGGSRSSPPPRGGRTARPRTPREEDLVELEYAEALGATVDEAIKNALEILGADADEVEVQVLEKGHRSFLGLGRSTPYRVRVSWREDLDEEVIEEEVPPGESPAPPPRVSAPAMSRERESRPSPSMPESSRPDRPAPPPVPQSSVPQPAFSEAVPRPRPAETSPSASPAAVADQVRQLLLKMGFDSAVEARAEGDELWIRIRLSDEEDA